MTMTAMIMAAGKGTRMRPLTNDRPKPLVQVGERTLIDFVLDTLRLAEVRKIVVNVHYLADQLEAHLQEHAGDFTVAISDERDALLETGGGLMKAKPLLGDQPFFCINTDNVWVGGQTDILADMRGAWDDARMDVLMLLVSFDRAHCHAGRGDFEMDARGRLSRTEPGSAKPWVWMGVQIIHPRLLVDPPGDAFSTNIFWDRAIAAGRCYGLRYTGDWYDVGTPAAIPVAEAAITRSKHTVFDN